TVAHATGEEDVVAPAMVTMTPRRSMSMFDIPRLARNRNGGAGGALGQKGIVQGAEGSNAGLSSTSSNFSSLFLVLSYIGVSILFYHFIEDWPIVDCVYYAMVIVTTVGYGDVTPKTTAGKAFTIFFAFYGIVTIGIALGKLARLFLDRQKSIAKEATRKMMHNVDSASTVANLQAAPDTAADKELALGVAVSSSSSGKAKKKTRRPKWFRAIFSDSNKAITTALVPIGVSIGGGLIIGAIEGWPVVDCFYFSIITITTVGFGDRSPTSEAARIFAIFYLPLAVVSVAHGIGSIAEEFSRRSVMKSKISMKELLEMDSDGDGKVSKLEYLSYMLVKLSKADQDDIDGILAQFNKLDRDGSGELDKADLERLDRELQRAQQAADDEA
ncbi:hypothetical protein PybrP1_007814, partial [[Pythium] brassicae (nom. inval.)]